MTGREQGAFSWGCWLHLMPWFWQVCWLVGYRGCCGSWSSLKVKEQEKSCAGEGVRLGRSSQWNSNRDPPYIFKLMTSAPHSSRC